jgi:hypothetical protein
MAPSPEKYLEALLSKFLEAGDSLEMLFQEAGQLL